MPVIGIPVNMLEERLGFTVDRDELVRHLQHVGCDVEGYAQLRRFKCARCDHVAEITETQEPPVECAGCGRSFREHPGDLTELGPSLVLRMELLAVRPDIFDPGGLARMLRAYLSKSTGLSSYDLRPARLSVRVDPVTRTHRCPRPAIACAAAYGLRLTEDFVKVVMKLQENLHWAMGRDRKHASIGVYDLDTVEGPEFHYEGVDPDDHAFVPLGFDPQDPAAVMTPRRILTDHPKGTAFAHLLERFELYPLLTDSKGRVLSMPPIINSEATRVRESTSSFFMDVTGTNRHIVNKALSVLVTSLLELQPDLLVEQVEVIYGEDDQVTTPDLTPQMMALDPRATSRVTGIELAAGEIVDLLGRMGHGVELSGKGDLMVSIPAFRSDILHPCDLMEDVAIAYGYHNIPRKLVPTMTVGIPHPTEERAQLARTILTGLGCHEVMTLMLGSPEQSCKAMRLDPEPRAVKIANPISADQTELRTSLLPGLLSTLKANTHRPLPQRIFEVGPVTFLDPAAETGASERLFAAAVFMDARAGAADARAMLLALLAELDLAGHLQVRNESRGTFLDGRCGAIYVKEIKVGYMGEIHPEVLERFSLGHPVAALEIDLDAAMDLGAGCSSRKVAAEGQG